jgi:2-keto-4-pentenoate hydratase/2-oxohepta-3-ene-1,7-dioic acid hydratase in catechol pathway
MMAFVTAFAADLGQFDGIALIFATALLARRPAKVAAIALANKLARMAWAMMARGELRGSAAGAVHVAEVGRTVTEKPALFARFAGSQVGHLQPLVKPAVSDQFDYEGELAVVIGKEGRHIPALQRKQERESR